MKRGKSWGKFGFFLTNVFDQTSEREQILTKTIFLLKMCHIQLKCAFLLFGSIFAEIHWKYLLLIKKKIISERNSEILRNYFFHNTFEKQQIQRKILICCKQPFSFKRWNGTNINKNYIFPKNEPHTTKLCFSVVFKHFWENLLKTSLFSQKVAISERSTEILREFFFLNKFEKGKIQKKIWIWCK